VKLKPEAILVRITHYGRRQARYAELTQDRWFAVHQTIEHWPELGYTVTHVPTGCALAQNIADRRTAELLISVYRRIDLPWQRKSLAPIAAAFRRLPRKLQVWLKLWQQEDKPILKSRKGHHQNATQLR
jgi:hypothetical protein